jgi:hypothetical protein
VEGIAMLKAKEYAEVLDRINAKINRETPSLPSRPWTKSHILGMAFEEGEHVIVKETNEEGIVIGVSNRILLRPPTQYMTDGGGAPDEPQQENQPKETWKGLLAFRIPEKRDVEVYIVELPDGRIVARTKEELEKKAEKK